MSAENTSDGHDSSPLLKRHTAVLGSRLRAQWDPAWPEPRRDAELQALAAGLHVWGPLLERAWASQAMSEWDDDDDDDNNNGDDEDKDDDNINNGCDRTSQQECSKAYSNL